MGEVCGNWEEILGDWNPCTEREGERERARERGVEGERGRGGEGRGGEG